MKLLILLLSLGAVATNAQVFRPRFELSSAAIVSNRPSGNFIGVITVHDDTVWMDASGLLNRSTDRGETWTIFNSSDGIGKGGIASIFARTGAVFLTTIHDTSVSPPATNGAGGGITYSFDGGQNWLRISQPTDTATMRGWIRRTNPTTGRLDSLFVVKDRTIRNLGSVLDTVGSVAVKTTIDNVSFDIAVTDSSVWIPCFAGGLRVAPRSGNAIGTFTQAALPTDTLLEVRPDVAYGFDLDPVENLNHRAFAVLAASDGIWAGTAGGINRSTDGGISWTRTTAANSGISGNFVVALGEQIYTEDAIVHHHIWAATNRALGATERNGLSYTADSGRTWKAVLVDRFVNNIAFDGKSVYAATDAGMYVSFDLGLSWIVYLTITDPGTGDRTFHPEFPSVGVLTSGSDKFLLFGNSDGLAISGDNGNTWTIRRAFRSPGVDGTPKSYAYPNPFSPGIAPGVARFQYDATGLTTTDRVTLTIYDFALDWVATVARDVPIDQTLVWDGRTGSGKRAANGTYVYVLQAGKKKFWGKVTVRN